jgi:prevent-host-death family protein
VEISSTEAQNNFGRYLKLAQFEDIIITKNGKKTVTIKRYAEPAKSLSISEEAEGYTYPNQKISYEDFLKLSEAGENRYEYMDGEVFLAASPSYDHQRITVEIVTAMHHFFKGQICRPLTAPFDVTLTVDGRKNVVQPDIIVICDTENINEKGRYAGIPALVVEVISESTQKKDMLMKLNLYFHAGIKEYWIVDPIRSQVYFYLFAESDIQEYRVFYHKETIKSLAFPGLAIPLEEIFEKKRD